MGYYCEDGWFIFGIIIIDLINYNLQYKNIRMVFVKYAGKCTSEKSKDEKAPFASEEHLHNYTERERESRPWDCINCIGHLFGTCLKHLATQYDLIYNHMDLKNKSQRKWVNLL